MARDVRVAILGDSRDFKRAVDAADRDAGRFGNATNRMGSAARMMGTAITVAAGAAVVAIGKLAVDSISAASSLEESLSKSNTVFGQQGAAMERWADTAAESFGQSKREALDAAGAFGNMFVQLGIGTMESAHLSASMTELASDFASFHNADITEVLTAQQAAFRGEYDAVQRFVPTINAAAVEQKALEMGLAETTKELDQQDKALATYQLLMEGAGDAAGDFDRTSGSLANQQRTLSARFEDVKARIGQGLLPIATTLAAFIADEFLPAFEDLATYVSDNVIPAIQDIGKFVSDNQPVFTAAAAVIGGALVAAFLAWAASAAAAAAATLAAAAPVLAVGAALAALTAGIIWAYRNWDWFRTAVNGARDALKWVWENVLKPIAGFITNTAAPAVANLGATFVSAAALIAGYVGPVFGWMRDVLGTVLGAINNVVGALGRLRDAWNSVKGFMLDGNIGNIARDMANNAGGGRGRQKFHSGGVFRAPGGMDEGLALLKDGERILSPTQSMNASGGGGSVNITVNALDPRSAAAAVVEALKQYNRSNGPIPVRVA